MKFVKIALHLIQALYLFLLYVIRVVYSFFQIHKSKVKPYKFKINVSQFQSAPKAKKLYVPNMRSLRAQRRSRVFGGVIARKLTNRSQRFYKITGGVAVVACVVVGVVSLSGIFNVDAITVTGVSEQNQQIVSAQINKAVKDKTISQNTLFFSIQDIRSKILQQHPTIADIRVKKSLPSSVSVQVVDRTQAGIWCLDTTPEPEYVPVVRQVEQETEDDTQESTDGVAEQESEPVVEVTVIKPEQRPLQCFYHGDDGVIFESSPQTSQGFLIREVRDKRYKTVRPTINTSLNKKKQQEEQEGQKQNSTVYLGDQVLTEQDMQQLDLLYIALQEGVEAPTYITIVDDVEMRAGFQQGWEVYFSRQDPLVQQVENTAVILEQHIKRNKRFLEYIDVRYGNKIFYKYIAL